MSSQFAIDSKFKPWSEQSAILVGTQAEKMATVIRPMIRGFNWDIKFTSNSIEEAFIRLKSGQAQLIIFDESEDLPSYSLLKLQLADPIACLTPCLYLLHDQHGPGDLMCMKKFLANEIIIKPPTTKGIQPKLSALLTHWAKPLFVQLRQAAQALALSQTQHATLLLAQLCRDPQTAGVAGPALSRLLQANLEFKSAEQTLLDCIKLDPHNVGLIVATAQFYLRSSRPQIAGKLINEIRVNHGSPLMLFADLAQIHILLNEPHLALPYIKELHRKNVSTEMCNHFLAKIYLSEGFLDQFHQCFVGQKNIEKEILSTWQPPSPQAKVS